MTNTDDKRAVLIDLIRANASNMTEGYLITSNTRLIEDLNYDSVDLIQLIVDIEDEFGISLINNELIAEKLNTPEELYEMVCIAINSSKEAV